MGRILAAGKVRTAERAFAVSVQTYNDTPQPLLAGFAPNEITWDNLEQVIEHQVERRDDIWAKYRESYPVYKIGDFVRLRILPSKFRKSNESSLSKDVFEIIDIKRSRPTPSYILRSTTSAATLPGTVTFDKLSLASDYRNNNNG